MAVGDKTPKQGPVKVFQFASKFVGYNHLASVLRVKDAYFQVQLHFALPDRKFFRFFNFENTVNFSMDSTAKFSDIQYLREKSSKFHAKRLFREIIHI